MPPLNVSAPREALAVIQGTTWVGAYKLRPSKPPDTFVARDMWQWMYVPSGAESITKVREATPDEIRPLAVAAWCKFVNKKTGATTKIPRTSMPVEAWTVKQTALGTRHAVVFRRPRNADPFARGMLPEEEVMEAPRATLEEHIVTSDLWVAARTAATPGIVAAARQSVMSLFSETGRAPANDGSSPLSSIKLGPGGAAFTRCTALSVALLCRGVPLGSEGRPLVPTTAGIGTGMHAAHPHVTATTKSHGSGGTLGITIKNVTCSSAKEVDALVTRWLGALDARGAPPTVQFVRTMLEVSNDTLKAFRGQPRGFPGKKSFKATVDAVHGRHAEGTFTAWLAPMKTNIATQWLLGAEAFVAWFNTCMTTEGAWRDELINVGEYFGRVPAKTVMDDVEFAQSSCSMSGGAVNLRHVPLLMLLTRLLWHSRGGPRYHWTLARVALPMAAEVFQSLGVGVRWDVHGVARAFVYSGVTRGPFDAAVAANDAFTVAAHAALANRAFAAARPPRPSWLSTAEWPAFNAVPDTTLWVGRPLRPGGSHAFAGRVVAVFRKAWALPVNDGSLSPANAAALGTLHAAFTDTCAWLQRYAERLYRVVVEPLIPTFDPATVNTIEAALAAVGDSAPRPPATVGVCCGEAWACPRCNGATLPLHARGAGTTRAERAHARTQLMHAVMLGNRMLESVYVHGLPGGAMDGKPTARTPEPMSTDPVNPFAVPSDLGAWALLRRRVLFDLHYAAEADTLAVDGGGDLESVVSTMNRATYDVMYNTYRDWPKTPFMRVGGTDGITRDSNLHEAPVYVPYDAPYTGPDEWYRALAIDAAVDMVQAVVFGPWVRSLTAKTIDGRDDAPFGFAVSAIGTAEEVCDAKVVAAQEPPHGASSTYLSTSRIATFAPRTIPRTPYMARQAECETKPPPLRDAPNPTHTHEVEIMAKMAELEKASLGAAEREAKGEDRPGFRAPRREPDAHFFDKRVPRDMREYLPTWRGTSVQNFGGDYAAVMAKHPTPGVGGKLCNDPLVKRALDGRERFVQKYHIVHPRMPDRASRLQRSTWMRTEDITALVDEDAGKMARSPAQWLCLRCLGALRAPEGRGTAAPVAPVVSPPPRVPVDDDVPLDDDGAAGAEESKAPDVPSPPPPTQKVNAVSKGMFDSSDSDDDDDDDNEDDGQEASDSSSEEEEEEDLEEQMPDDDAVVEELDADDNAAGVVARIVTAGTLLMEHRLATCVKGPETHRPGTVSAIPEPIAPPVPAAEGHRPPTPTSPVAAPDDFVPFPVEPMVLVDDDEGASDDDVAIEVPAVQQPPPPPPPPAAEPPQSLANAPVASDNDEPDRVADDDSDEFVVLGDGGEEDDDAGSTGSVVGEIPMTARADMATGGSSNDPTITVPQSVFLSMQTEVTVTVDVSADSDGFPAGFPGARAIVLQYVSDTACSVNGVQAAMVVSMEEVCTLKIPASSARPGSPAGDSVPYHYAFPSEFVAACTVAGAVTHGHVVYATPVIAETCWGVAVATGASLYCLDMVSGALASGETLSDVCSLPWRPLGAADDVESPLAARIEELFVSDADAWRVMQHQAAAWHRWAWTPTGCADPIPMCMRWVGGSNTLVATSHPDGEFTAILRGMTPKPQWPADGCPALPPWVLRGFRDLRSVGCKTARLRTGTHDCGVLLANIAVFMTHVVGMTAPLAGRDDEEVPKVTLQEKTATGNSPLKVGEAELRLEAALANANTMLRLALVVFTHDDDKRWVVRTEAGMRVPRIDTGEAVSEDVLDDLLGTDEDAMTAAAAAINSNHFVVLPDPPHTGAVWTYRFELGADVIDGAVATLLEVLRPTWERVDIEFVGEPFATLAAATADHMTPTTRGTVFSTAFPLEGRPPPGGIIDTSVVAAGQRLEAGPHAGTWTSLGWDTDPSSTAFWEPPPCVATASQFLSGLTAAGPLASGTRPSVVMTLAPRVVTRRMSTDPLFAWRVVARCAALNVLHNIKDMPPVWMDAMRRSCNPDPHAMVIGFTAVAATLRRKEPTAAVAVIEPVLHDVDLTGGMDDAEILTVRNPGTWLMNASSPSGTSPDLEGENAGMLNVELLTYVCTEVIPCTEDASPPASWARATSTFAVLAAGVNLYTIVTNVDEDTRRTLWSAFNRTFRSVSAETPEDALVEVNAHDASSLITTAVSIVGTLQATVKQ